MNPYDIEQFLVLRADLFAAIENALARDGHCKSYEGEFAIRFPNYFEGVDADPGAWHITLNCYVVGPSRHYDWYGDSFADAMRKAEKDIRLWIAEAKAEE